MELKYKFVLAIWVMQFVNYLDRVNISIAAPTMMKSLQIDPGSFGWVLAAFTLGYLVMQIPGGILADRLGAKTLLIAAPIVWSIFTGLTGLATSVAGLVIVRFCFGLAEGSSNSACYKIVGDNFESKDRAKAQALWFTALALGPAFVAPIASLLLQHLGWQHMFFWFSVPGFLVAILLYFMIPDQRKIPVVKDSLESGPNATWKDVLSKRSSWLMFAACVAFNIGYWGYLGWMPSYLSLERGIDIKALGYAASIPYLCGFVGLLVFGFLGSSVLFPYRAQLTGVGYAMAAFFLYVTFSATDIVMCMVGLCGTAFCLYGCFAAYTSLVIDMGPVNGRGMFAGFINTGCQTGGFIAPIVVGYAVRETGSFTAGFVFMIGALLIATVCYFRLASYLPRKEMPLAVPHSA